MVQHKPRCELCYHSEQRHAHQFTKLVLWCKLKKEPATQPCPKYQYEPGTT